MHILQFNKLESSSNNIIQPRIDSHKLELLEVSGVGDYQCKTYIDGVGSSTSCNSDFSNSAPFFWERWAEFSLSRARAWSEALRADVDRNYISLIELGRNSPSVRVVFRLCEALDVSPADLMRDVERRMNARPQGPRGARAAES